jgi:hypothetical protein
VKFPKSNSCCLARIALPIDRQDQEDDEGHILVRSVSLGEFTCGATVRVLRRAVT